MCSLGASSGSPKVLGLGSVTHRELPGSATSGSWAGSCDVACSGNHPKLVTSLYCTG